MSFIEPRSKALPLYSVSPEDRHLQGGHQIPILHRISYREDMSESLAGASSLYEDGHSRKLCRDVLHVKSFHMKQLSPPQNEEFPLFQPQYRSHPIS